MSWFYLALLAPLFYAFANLIDDNLVQNTTTGPYFITIVAGLGGLLPLLSLFFVHLDSISMGLSALAILTGFLTTWYYFFYFKALEVESPSVVIALFSLTPATLPFLAHFLLHEHLDTGQLVGLGVVLLASLGIAINKGDKFKLSKAIVPAMIVVVLVDVISLVSKYTYSHASFYPVYIAYSLGLGLGGVYFMLVVHHAKKGAILSSLKEILRKYFVLFIFSELFALSAEFVQNLAVDRGPVSLVRVIEGVQPMFVLLTAVALYPFWPKAFREAKEGGVSRKLILMVIIIFGLFLIERASRG